jgi:hypothetical protein
VDLSSTIVQTQPNDVHQLWTYSTLTCQLLDEGTCMHSLIPTKSARHYPLINDFAARLPYLLAPFPLNLHRTINSLSPHPAVHSLPSKQNLPQFVSIDFLPHSTLLSQLSSPIYLMTFSTHGPKTKTIQVFNNPHLISI